MRSRARQTRRRLHRVRRVRRQESIGTPKTRSLTEPLPCAVATTASNGKHKTEIDVTRVVTVVLSDAKMIPLEENERES